MSGISHTVRNTGTTSRLASRRAATTAEIVAAAWDLTREHGLAGLSMRELGDRVGMRAQSLYSYFASKDDIYDAMYRQGWAENLVWMSDPGDDVGHGGADPIAAMRASAHRFFAFCTSDPVRYQLLFQRTLPGFQPSAESYAVATAALTQMQAGFARAGITDPDASDLATAVFTGLTSQQLANDPGGDRWQRLIDRAADMVLREIAPEAIGVDSSAPRSPASTSAPTRRSR